LDTNIILVNIGHLNREQIARQIKLIRSHEPKAIGFDAFFSLQGDSVADADLKSQFDATQNLIMACYLTGKESLAGKYDSLETSNTYFDAGTRALVNLGGANPETSTVRTFCPSKVFKGDTLWAMAAELVRFYDREAFERLSGRDNEKEVINYIGNRNAFICFDAEESLDSATDLSIIRNKIVLMGYMNNTFNHAMDLEDIYYTPLNPELAGRSRPDMYGVVIHANATSMILSGSYISVMPPWLCILLSYIFCYFYVYLITWYKARSPERFKIIFPFLLLAINVLLVYLFFILYKTCNYSISATYFLVPILLYDTFRNWYERSIFFLGKHFKVPRLFLPPNIPS
jgi:CHASE2 domain-containing sensor protein